MTDQPNGGPRKLKAAIALFEGSGRPQEDVQNGLPRSKNAGLTLSPTTQTPNYLSQLKKTGAEPSTDQNDFRAILKPTKCKPNIAPDTTNQTITDGSQIPHTNSQVKASEAGGVPSTTALKKGFKMDLANAISGQNSTTPKKTFNTGLVGLPAIPGKSPTDTTQSQPTTPNWKSALKSTTAPFGVTPEPPTTNAQRNSPGTQKPPPLPGTSASIQQNRTNPDGKSNLKPQLPQKTTPILGKSSPDSKPPVLNKPYTLPQVPKTGQNWKINHPNEAGPGKNGSWSNSSTQPKHSRQIMSANGKKYRLLPPPITNRDTCPRKPRLPPSVNLTQFSRFATGTNDTLAKVPKSKVPPVPPSFKMNTLNIKVASNDRPVSMIPEWTEEDEAREANPRAAQQQWVTEDEDTYEISSSNNSSSYVNDTQSQTWRKQTEGQTRIVEETDEDFEEAIESDDSDYENIDSFN